MSSEAQARGATHCLAGSDRASNHNSLSKYTPYFVGALYAIFITLETPVSGMSMNPARTFGPALRGRYWHALWVYFLAPTFGMLVASEFFLRMCGGIGPYCAKLHPANHTRCIFRHGTHQVRPLATHKQHETARMTSKKSER